MAAGDVSLVFRLVGDVSDGVRALKGAGDEAEKTEGRMSRFGRVAAVGLLAAGAAAGKFAADSVAAYTESQTSAQQLQDAFARFPALADTNISKLQELNSALALKTKFDDDATASGQAVLAGFKLTGTQIADLTPLLQDYAAKTGKDLPTAAKDLGKAVLGQGKSLKAIGLNLKDTGTAAGNFDQLMNGLRTQVGGFAEGEGKTAAGQAAILSNQFGEIQENVGAKLVPALTDLTAKLIPVATWIGNNVGLVGSLLGVLAAVAATVWAVSAATAVWSTVQTIAGAATKAWAGVQWLLNAAMTANPIGIVIVLVAALIAAVVLAWRHSDRFRAVVQAALRGVVAAFGWLWAKAQQVFGWIRSNWRLIFAILTGPIGLAVRWILSHWGSLRNGVVTRTQSLLGWIRGLPGRILSALGNLARLLAAPGRAVIDGFLDGIRSGFDRVRSELARLTGMLPDWKGPRAVDEEILYGPGRIVMGGFRRGLVDGFDDVRGTLGRVAPTLPTMFSGGGGSVVQQHTHYHVHGPVITDDRQLQAKLDQSRRRVVRGGAYVPAGA